MNSSFIQNRKHSVPMELRELSAKENESGRQELEYLRESRQLHFREMDEAVVPPKLKKDIVKDNIPACVQDPFSALYSYRGETLQQGLVRTHVIGNDDKIKEVRTHVEKQETVKHACW